MAKDDHEMVNGWHVYQYGEGWCAEKLGSSVWSLDHDSLVETLKTIPEGTTINVI